MPPWMLSNFVVVLLVGLMVWGYILVSRRRLWKEAFAELRRRRPIAISIVGLYVLIALLDSISWIGGRQQESMRWPPTKREVS